MKDEIISYLQQLGLSTAKLESTAGIESHTWGKFLNLFKYLRQNSLPDQESLDICVDLAKKQSEMKKYEQNLGKMLDILNTLIEKNIVISKAELKTILATLTKAEIKWLERTVKGLAAYQLLDTDAFQRALQHIATPLPPVAPATFMRISRKETAAPRSEFRFVDGTTIYPEPGRHLQKDLVLAGILKGTTAPIKKAFDAQEASEPKYMIKAIGRSHTRSQEDDTREAQMEVSIQTLLGRHALYFHREGKANPRVVMAYMPGKDINSHNRTELQATSFATRLECIADGLRDLSRMHANGFAHSDIHQMNFRLDLTTKKMWVIDFGSTHKFCAPEYYTERNPVYNDCTLSEDEHRDLYATGIVVTQLFPELYKLECNGTSLTTTLKEEGSVGTAADSNSAERLAITRLVDTMKHPDLNIRCTSASALAYCEEILEHMRAGTLNAANIEAVAQTTIERPSTFADVLCGRCPS